MPAVSALNEIFAANRSIGEVSLEVGSEGNMTRRQRVFEAGPLRVRFPETTSGGLEAMIVNTAGGVAGGDRHRIDISVNESASLVVTTAAAEKVYRSLGPNAEIGVTLRAGKSANVTWLPQETILFDQARLARTIDVELDDGASLLMAEAVVFGRSAMGERVESGHLSDRWRIRRGERLVFAEAVLLDDLIADRLGRSAVARGGVAIATVLFVPGDEAALERVRAVSGNFAGEVGVSSWNDLVVARLCAKDGASLRCDLAAVLTALGGELPRLWLH